MGTALDPQDYAGLSSQTLTFAAGETSKTISVSTLDDTIFEGATPETMFLNLSNAVNSTIADNQGQLLEISSTMTLNLQSQLAMQQSQKAAI